MQQATVRWQLKTFRGNVACCAGTTIGLFSLGKSLCAVCVVCSLWLARKKMFIFNISRYQNDFQNFSQMYKMVLLRCIFFCTSRYPMINKTLLPWNGSFC